MPDQVAAAAGPGPVATSAEAAPPAPPGPPPAPPGDGVAFTLNGRPAVAEKGEMLIAAAERAGEFIPRFCYHPRMKSVGVCRMCLVEVSGPRGATLQPACFIPVTPGMEVDTRSAKVRKAQDGVLEFLLVNHPLDCPVCDKGGECPLQDQTLAYGPGESRFVEEKRHFEKPIPLSELVLLDRERCIQCSRCTRFAEEVAGEALIDFAGRGERVEVATFPDQPFTSYFSGNTVQICPVGALTATPYRFTARPWDLEQVESTCTTCAVGCRVAVQSSGNRLTRLLGIDSEPVNHGWLCDKGRFAYEAVNGDEVAAGPDPSDPEADPGRFDGEAGETGRTGPGRLTVPLVRKDGRLEPASWSAALSAAAQGLRLALDAGGPSAVAVLGGARLTNEAAYAFTKLAKGVIGTDSVDAQLGDGLPAEVVLGLPRATIDQACAARTVVLLAGDLREELPVLFLRLRAAAVDGPARLLEVTPRPTALTRYAAVSLATRPGEAPTVVRALTGDAAAAKALSAHPEGAAVSAADLERGRALLDGDGSDVVVVVGRSSLAESAGVTAAAAAALARALPGARFLPALRRGNVMGALDMGMAPGILPGRTSLADGGPWFASAWGRVPAAPGLDADGILAAAASGEVRALVLAGCDPLTDHPDAARAAQALDGGAFVVAVAGHPSASTDRADVVLPAAVAHERPGTTTNIEGRVTRLGQMLVAPGEAWPDWMIAAELAFSLGADLGVSSAGELWAEIERLAPAYAGLTTAVLEGTPAHDGVLVPLGPASVPTPGAAPAGPDGAAGAPGIPAPGSPAADAAHGPYPIDPIALPGIDSVERQGAPPRVGLAEPVTAGIDGAVPAPAPPTGARPPLLGMPATLDEPHVAPPDSYSLRLVVTRCLYDAGNAVTSSPSLAPLVPAVAARANPYDLDRLGVTTGDPVRLRSTRGDLVLPARADDGVPRGVVAVDFNLPGTGGGPDNPAAHLIDASAPVTDVRLESVA